MVAISNLMKNLAAQNEEALAKHFKILEEQHKVFTDQLEQKVISMIAGQQELLATQQQNIMTEMRNLLKEARPSQQQQHEDQQHEDQQQEINRTRTQLGTFLQPADQGVQGEATKLSTPTNSNQASDKRSKSHKARRSALSPKEWHRNPETRRRSRRLQLAAKGKKQNVNNDNVKASEDNMEDAPAMVSLGRQEDEIMQTQCDYEVEKAASISLETLDDGNPQTRRRSRRLQLASKGKTQQNVNTDNFKASAGDTMEDAPAMVSLGRQEDEIMRTQRDYEADKAASISLDTLDDDFFCHIAKYTHCTSLCGVAKLCREVGAVSKALRQKCHTFMTATPLDINMNEINTTTRKKYILPAVLWVKERKANLRSFVLNCNEKDYGIVAGVLTKCNTAAIQELMIRHEHMSILGEYWYGCIPHTHFYNGTNIPVKKSHNEMALDCGVNHSDLVCPPSILRASILDNASTIKKLCLRFHNVDPAFGFLTELGFVEHLECLIHTQDKQLYDRLGQAIEGMKQLKELRMVKPLINYEVTTYWIRSKTLEMIDVSEIHKGCWFYEVNCPSLKLFKCRGNLYGNGIRPDLTSSENRSIRCSGAKSAGEFRCQGVIVPDSCIFDFGHYYPDHHHID